MKKTYHFIYDTLLEFGIPIESHSFVLRCIPPSFPGQEILNASLVVDPTANWTLQRDGFGNLTESGFLPEPHDVFRYAVYGTAVIDVEKREREPLLPIYRYPSEHTVLSDEMKLFLSQSTLPSDDAGKAWKLAELVHEHMTYRSGVTGVSTTSSEAFALGAGVCQDFAHIYLTLARESGLAARYVSGLTEGDDVSHAWCEVYLDGIWKGIDPTRLVWCDSTYIRFNVGRDFLDCPIERGMFHGLANQSQTVTVQVTEF